MTTPDLKALREALGRLRRSVDMDPSWSKRSPVYWGDVVTAICEGERLMKENTALLARLSAAERDAGRYRYLRRPEAWKEDYLSAKGGISCIFVSNGHTGFATDTEALDTAIDTAIAATQEGKS